jgi:hypothetical protein
MVLSRRREDPRSKRWIAPSPCSRCDQGCRLRRTTEYRRHGVGNLYAALDVASGKVITTTTKAHRTKEFIEFLELIDRRVPKGLAVHLVLDNDAAHKTEAVRTWLLRHPRFVFHFTPTYSSWMNQVERWFSSPDHQVPPAQRASQRRRAHPWHQGVD